VGNLIQLGADQIRDDPEVARLASEVRALNARLAEAEARIEALTARGTALAGALITGLIAYLAGGGA